MKLFKRTALAAGAIAVTFACMMMIAPPQSLHAFNPQPEPPKKAFSLWDDAAMTIIITHPPDPIIPGCEGVVEFYAENGRTLGSHPFRLGRNESTSVTIFDPFPGDRVRTIVGVRATARPLGCAGFTTEIYSRSTMETRAIYAGPL